MGHSPTVPGQGRSERQVSKEELFVVRDVYRARMPWVPTNTGHTDSGWGLAVFAAIGWQRFEAVFETLFVQAGFTTKTKPHGTSGGTDIWLHSAHARGVVAMVRCKHWHSAPVEPIALQDFYRTMNTHQIKRGTYATTSNFTNDAKTYAKDHGINAMDGPALLALIGRRTPEQQRALLAVAYEGEQWRPTCPSCGIKLLERPSAHKPDSGCSKYPRCRSSVPSDVRRR